jgi:hypothetical protein
MTNMLDTNVLAESSARWMQAGLEAFTRQADAHDFAVHHCAVAVEHLLKAYLASLHPALIVQGQDLDSLLHATGHGPHAAVPVTRIKTIGLAEALTRAERFLRPQIAVGNRERSQVLAARNGVAHGGLHDPTEVEAVLATCTRIADTILIVLGKPTQEAYWGHYRDLRERLAEDHANSTRIRYESMLAHARQAYQHRFDRVMTPEEKAAIVAALTVGLYSSDRESPRTCPACREKGVLKGVNRYPEMSPAEHASDADDRAVVFLSDSFDCAVCGLYLQGPEELELAKIPTQITQYYPGDDHQPWARYPYGPESDEYDNYMPQSGESDYYGPGGDYEAEDDPENPDWVSYEHDGGVRRFR